MCDVKVRGNQRMEPTFTGHLCVSRAGIHGALRMSDTVPVIVLAPLIAMAAALSPFSQAKKWRQRE